MKRSLLTGLCAASLGACAGPAPRARTVVSEGWAAADAAHGESRRRALADAQRRAIEEVSGVSVASVARVENGRLKSSNTVAASRGRLSGYELLEETREDGMLRVRIRARVEPAASADAPRLHGIRLSADAGAAASSASEELSRLGAENAPDGGLLLRAEQSSARVVDARIAPMVATRASVRLRLIEKANGAVLAEASRESSALGADYDAASRAAVEAAARAAASELAARLEDAPWRR